MSADNAVQPEDNVHVLGRLLPQFEEILSSEALGFVSALERQFGERSIELLELREVHQQRLNEGEVPDFCPDTVEIRAAEWKVKAIPHDLQDRRVELTSPVDRKMIINGLNSGANGYMADFEDAHSPTWEATVQGQVNLRDAVRGDIFSVDSDGKQYRLNQELATLHVRPRGWHLPEKHFEVDGRQISAALFDIGLFLFHNARGLLEKGSGPYFYLPKLEGANEAQLWADVFEFAEAQLGLVHGSICCTVIVETIPAVFEMDEILYTLRDYAVGLNCGRWDYIFSFIKRFHANSDWLLPDRNRMSMDTPFLRAYSRLLIKTCHRRGAHAMGGASTQIPSKHDPVVDAAAREQVKADKLREVLDGHDGSWVAHPELILEARAVFDEHMPGLNQVDKMLVDLSVTAQDLLELPLCEISGQGLRENVTAGVRYLAGWFSGRGCVLINNLMEDAATTEIAVAQVWQWVRYPQGVLEDGRKVTLEMVATAIAGELASIREEMDEEAFSSGNFEQAAELFYDLVANKELIEYFTLPAYESLA